jgi:uncharacterized protein (DUF302 family)
MDLRPTELLIFRNPKAGTPLMQADQMMAIDLPLKALGWQDAAGKCWLTYPDLPWLARRYGLASDTEKAVAVLATLLASLAAAAVA